MATLTVRGIPETEKEALRVRAARNGHSMEAELRRIIHDAVKESARGETNLAAAIRRHVEPFGGFDIPEHPAVTPREPPRFE